MKPTMMRAMRTITREDSLFKGWDERCERATTPGSGGGPKGGCGGTRESEERDVSASEDSKGQQRQERSTNLRTRAQAVGQDVAQQELLGTGSEVRRHGARQVGKERRGRLRPRLRHVVRRQGGVQE